MRVEDVVDAPVSTAAPPVTSAKATVAPLPRASGGKPTAAAPKGGDQRSSCRMLLERWRPQLMLLAALLPTMFVTICIVRMVVSPEPGTNVWAAVGGVLRAGLSTPLLLYAYIIVKPGLMSSRKIGLILAACCAVDMSVALGYDLVRPNGDLSPVTPVTTAWTVTESISSMALLGTMPYLFWREQRLSLKSSQKRADMLAPKSAVMGFGSVGMVLFANVANLTTLLGGPDLLSYAFLVMVPWAVALAIDRHRGGDFRRCIWYALAFTFMIEGLGVGGSSSLLGVIEISLALSPEFAQVLTFIIYSFLFAILRWLFARTASAYVGAFDGVVFMFVVQLFEDVYTELAFLGVSSFSVTFFLIVLMTVLRQLARDTSLITDFIDSRLRRLRGLPERTLQEKRRRYEYHLRIMEQNLISELLTALFVPLLLLLDLAFDFGSASVTAGMTTAEALDQVFVYSFLLVIELAMHWLIHQLKLRRLRALCGRQSASVYAADEEAGDVDAEDAAVSTVTARMVMKGSKGGKKALDGSFGGGSFALDRKPSAERLSWNVDCVEEEYGQWLQQYMSRNLKYLFISTMFVAFDATMQFAFLQASLVKLRGG